MLTHSEVKINIGSGCGDSHGELASVKVLDRVIVQIGESSITEQIGSDYEYDGDTLHFPVIHFKMICSRDKTNRGMMRHLLQSFLMLKPLSRSPR